MRSVKPKYLIIRGIVTALIIIPSFLYSQNDKGKGAGYLELYKSGNYNGALERIIKTLNEIYSKRIKYRAVPTGFISTRDTGSAVDLKKVFADRKAEGFFIEENSDLHMLHLYAARIYDIQKNYPESLNHYFQSLRFKKLEFKKDDTVFYEIARVYKKSGHFNGYINALETAYSLNSYNLKYSLELGTELARTVNKKRAIHYLKRYLKSEDKTPKPEIYLLIGNLNEDIGKYLETEKYYTQFLKLKPDDTDINFALGYIAYKRTGNHRLAVKLLTRALELLPENDIYRRSKSYEYIADISMSSLEYGTAINNYLNCIKYQMSVEKKVENLKDKLKEINAGINDLKASLLKNRDFDDYSAYEFLLDDRGKLEQDLRTVKSSFNRLNPGKVRWNLARAYEKNGNLDEAVNYYRSAVRYNYNPVKARKKIEKLQLVIQRGY